MDTRIIKTVRNRLLAPTILALLTGCSASSYMASSSDDIYYNSKSDAGATVIRKGAIDEQTEQLAAKTKKAVAEKTVYLDADKVYMKSPSTLHIEGDVDTVVYSDELADADSYERQLKMFDDPRYNIEINLGYGWSPYYNYYGYPYYGWGRWHYGWGGYGWGYPYYGWGFGGYYGLDMLYYGGWGYPYYGWGYGGWGYPYYGCGYGYGWGGGYSHGGFYGYSHTYAAGHGNRGLRYDRINYRSSSSLGGGVSSGATRTTAATRSSAGRSNFTRIDNASTQSRTSYNRNGATTNRGNAVGDIYSTRTQSQRTATATTSRNGNNVQSSRSTTSESQAQVYTRPSSGSRSSYNSSNTERSAAVSRTYNSASSSSQSSPSYNAPNRSSSSSSSSYSAPSRSSSTSYSTSSSRSGSSGYSSGGGSSRSSGGSSSSGGGGGRSGGRR